jgi:hypothetical protein
MIDRYIDQIRDFSFGADLTPLSIETVTAITSCHKKELYSLDVVPEPEKSILSDLANLLDKIAAAQGWNEGLFIRLSTQ